MSDERDLLARIAAGPRFLLLGQSLDRLGLVDAPEDSTWFFPAELMPDPATRIPSLESDAFQTYESRLGDAPRPVELDNVAPLAWNGVLTSRIDSSVSRWFESEWRRVVPSAAREGSPSRSTTELQIRYLFGGLGLPEDERPPTSDLEWIDAQRNASDALSTLATNLITPKGVLLVDGWSLNDWLSPTDLYNLASRLAPGQVHIFSVGEDVRTNPVVAAAIGRGAIAVHDESLDEVLREAASNGLLPTPSGDFSDRSRLIPAGSGFAQIDVATWNRVVGTARPVDLELLEPFLPASGPLAYQRFRAFLGSPEGAPPWRAVASGLKLPRSYEPDLLAMVDAALEEAEDTGPIVLQGQTATGKTLALVWLAQVLARSGKVAVLHQSRRRDRPVASDIEAFSLWAEDIADLRTVLIWDGMVDSDDYYALHRQLRARGQRVLIVGTTYLSSAGGDRVLTAPIHLDSHEAERVGPWLSAYGIELPPTVAGADTSFLALLYRVLPETEAGLRRGLALEMRAAESGMEALSRERRQQEPESRMTAIAQALLAAGMEIETLVPAEHSPDELADLTFAERSTTEQLSAMLLSAGRRGLNVPLELALRLVGREGSSAIVDFIRHFDIFRWTEEANGSQFLGVRTRLEAELLAREDLTDMTEVDVATSFIQNVRALLSTRSGGDEVQFIVDLMEQFGPQSEDQGRYARWYGDLAEAFRNQRERSGVVHPRLVLLEVNLAREFVKRSQRSGDLTHDQRLTRLRESEQLLLRILEEGDSSSRSRLNLYVELAASIGSQVHELVDEHGQDTQQAIAPLLERLVDAVMRAREADPENLYPVDVLAWSAKDAVASGGLSPEIKLNLLADAQASLDSLDPQDLSPRQQAKYRSRQAEIANMLGARDLENEYLLELRALGSPAAYYLLATRETKSADGPDGLKAALDTLLEAPETIRDDWKCARLLLDLFWRYRTGERLLRGERISVAFSDSDWRACLELVDSLRGAAGFDRYRITFVRGLALFHLGSITASQSEYRGLGSLGLDVSRRVHLAFVASNPDGTPKEFTGRVAWATPDGRRGRVWVDQLKAEIDFVPLRFSSELYRSRNEAVPTFHVGFNYRGPIADPIRRASRPRPGPVLGPRPGPPSRPRSGRSQA